MEEGEGQWHKQVVLRTAKKLDEWTLETEGRRCRLIRHVRASIGGGSWEGVALTFQSASRHEGVAAGVETLTVFLTRPRLESCARAKKV